MNQKLSVKVKNENIRQGQDTTLEGFAQIIQDKLWIHFQGRTVVQDLNKGSKKKRYRESTGGHNQICAPMPGKITKILVELNQKLNSGDAVIVMEAMKMEYTLKADGMACVEKILVSVGDQVPLGQTLVSLQPTL